MSSAAATVTRDAGAEAPPPKGKRKLLLIVFGALLLVVLAGGAAAVYLTKKRAAAAEDGEAPAAALRLGPPTYVPLEPFVVNLADKDAERYAQIGFTLEVDDAKVAEDLKLYMPAIRNAILMILAHKQSAELLERAGKEALAAEIMREAVRPLGIEIAPRADGEAAEAGAAHNPVRRVHFSSFIIQ